MVPIGMVFSIYDSTEEAIKKMIEANERMMKLGGGNDNVAGGNGIDILNGGGGNDRLDGGGLNDQIVGGSGDNTLTGGPGADQFSCGAGTDTITDFNAAQGDTKTPDCENF